MECHFRESLLGSRMLVRLGVRWSQEGFVPRPSPLGEPRDIILGRDTSIGSQGGRVSDRGQCLGSLPCWRRTFLTTPTPPPLVRSSSSVRSGPGRHVCVCVGAGGGVFSSTNVPSHNLLFATMGYALSAPKPHGGGGGCHKGSGTVPVGPFGCTHSFGFSEMNCSRC